MIEGSAAVILEAVDLDSDGRAIAGLQGLIFTIRSPTAHNLALEAGSLLVSFGASLNTQRDALALTDGVIHFASLQDGIERLRGRTWNFIAIERGVPQGIQEFLATRLRNPDGAVRDLVMFTL